MRQPSSLRVGPTTARNSASRSVSCPPRVLSSTTSVTASFGNFPSFDFRDALLRALGRLRRRLPEDLVARFAIRAGLYSNRAKTPPRPQQPQVRDTARCARLVLLLRSGGGSPSLLAFGPRSSYPNS